MNNVSNRHSNPHSKDAPFNFKSQYDPQRKSDDVIPNEVHYGTNVLTSRPSEHTTYHNLTNTTQVTSKHLAIDTLECSGGV